MVVKNSLKSETIESLSYKFSKMDANIFNAINNLTSFDGDPVIETSTKFVLENSNFEFIILGTNLTNDSSRNVTSIKFKDKKSDLEIEIKGELGMFNENSSTSRISSISLSNVIDGEKIILKQTFENFSLNYYTGSLVIKGVKLSIIDSKGGVLEIDAGDMNINEYNIFSSSSLENIILSVDPSYDFTQTSVVSHTDSKIPVIDDGNNIIKITTNNISEFETNENGDLVIQGFGGNDKITTTSENDYIDGGVGADIMNGGRGDDTYIVDNLKDMVKESANQGNDTIITTLNTFSLAKLPNVENLTYEGYVDADLTGNKQNNIIKAADGHDNLYGGLGNDTLTGGAGEDAFVFNTKLSSSNTDTITDFVSGEDWLSLNKKLFKKLAKSFTEDNLVYGEEAIESNDYLIFNSDNNTLYYDADGSGTKSSAVEIVVVGTMIDFDDIVVE